MIVRVVDEWCHPQLEMYIIWNPPSTLSSIVDIFINMSSFNLQSIPERRSSGFEVFGQKW